MDTAWVEIEGIDPEIAREICNTNNIPWDNGGHYLGIPRPHLDTFCFYGNLEKVGRERRSEREGFAIITLKEKVGGPAGRIAMAAPVGKPEYETAKQKFISVCINRHNDAGDTLKKELEKCDKDVAKAQKEMMEVMRKREEVVDQIKAMDAEGIRALCEKDLSDEYDAMVKSPKIQSIRYDEDLGSLVVITKDIRHKEEGALGTFEISLKIDRFDPDRIEDDHYGVNIIYIKPLTGRRRHPHYSPADYPSGNGGWCLGNAAQLSAKALRDFQVSLAIDIIIRFLEEG